MKKVACLALVIASIAAASGCAGTPTVKAAPAAINSMIFGSSSAGLTAGSVGTTIFIQTRTADPLNTDVYSIPMPSHAVLSHLHFATSANNLTSATATISVFVNGAATNLSCSVAGSEMSCSDANHSIPVNEGDLVTIGMTVANIPSPPPAGGIGPFWRASVGVGFE